jgi:hypothetical protein
MTDGSGTTVTAMARVEITWMAADLDVDASDRAGADGPGVVAAHRGPDRGEVMSGGHPPELV